MCHPHAPLLVFLFVLVRISGLVLLAPAIGGRHVSLAVRGLLAVALAVMIAAVHVHTAVPQPSPLVPFLAAVGREAVLGLMLGLALCILADGLHGAGQIVGQMSGLSLAEMLDHEQAGDGPMLGRWFELVATAVFLAIGGHRQVLAALLNSFAWMPPGHALVADGLFAAFVEILGQSFALAIRAAAPVMTALLLTTLALGIISRTWPQLNAFSLGFSLNALVAVAVLAVSLGGAAWLFREQVDTTVEGLRGVFASSGGGP
jgi:flagellar biosynthetic protein FliR